MKVICDNCRAVYKIPDEKLVKPVNKATCRQCGHRMLIPRPRMDADPDERTLVTAVPPTPAPPPPRAQFNDDPPTRPQAQNPEITNPGDSRDVELHTATPAPVSPNRSIPPRGRRTETQPTQPPKVAPNGSNHDPAKDISFAFIGVLASIFGALILAFVPLAPIPAGFAPISASLGLMIACGGALTALMVIITGDRGRKPAKWVLSVIFAVGFAFFIGLIPIAPIAIQGLTSMSSNTDSTTALDIKSEPQDATPDAKVDATVDTTPESTTEKTVDETEVEKPVAQKTPSSTPSTTKSRRRSSDTRASAREKQEPSTTSETRSTSRSGRSSVPDDELELPDDILKEEKPKARPATPSSTVASSETSGSTDSILPKKPSVGAIDVMVKSNVNVKKCFIKEMSSKGTKSLRINVKFTIRPDGSATKVGIKEIEYAATDLDFCLGSAIKSIRFPPSQEGLSLTFPFQIG